MMRHNLGLSLRQVGELMFERIGNAAMQFLPSSPKQASVRRILQQGMLKDVCGIRWFAAAKDQASAREFLQCRRQYIAGTRCNGREQTICKFPTDSRTDLSNFLDGTKPVKSRH
jgi:hypothetical protein